MVHLVRAGKINCSLVRNVRVLSWGDELKAFLSHNSKDKFFVHQVAELLGPLRVELDESTFEHILNVSAIRAALERSDIFVTFLSENSIHSSFVKEEQRAALEARGRGVLKRVMVFALDDTSYKSLPEWMQEINIVRKITSPKACARQIDAALLELAAQEDQGLALYIGRDTDEVELRRALAVPPANTPIFLHAVGHYGIGRRSFLSHSLKTLFPRLFESFVEISISNLEGTEEIYRRLYALHKIASLETAQRDFLEFAALNATQQAEQVASILVEMAAHGEFVLIVDGGGVFSDDGRLQTFFAELLNALDNQGRPCLGLIQTRMMPFVVRQEYPRNFHQYLKPLTDSVMCDLISLSLKELQIPFNESQVKQISGYLDGHPYNVRFAVQYILNFGIDSLLADPSDLLEWKNRRAVDFLRKIDFTPLEADLIALLSEYQNLGAASLVEALNADVVEVTRAVRRMQEFCCVELREGYFHVAAPLRDAIRRDARFHRDDSWKQTAGKAICNLVEDYSSEDQIPIQIIESAVLAAARSDVPPVNLAMFILPSHLLRIAREHYDAGRRGSCMEYCRRAYEMKGRLPTEAQVELFRLWGLSSVRLGDESTYRTILNELEKFQSRFAKRMKFFLEGFHARLKGQLDVAEERFLSAWQLARSNESINRELASLYCKERRYADAEVHARAAYEIAPTNPYIIDVFAETLLGKAQAGLPIDHAELDSVFEQLKIYGDAPGSSFYLIREAQLKARHGQRGEASRLINKAIERTPNLLSPYFIRADLRLGAGDPDGADHDLTKINQLLTDAGGFSEGEEAAAQELGIRIMMERRQFKAAKDRLERSAFLPHVVQKRLFDQLARNIAYEPNYADATLREWAKNRVI